MAGLDHGLAEDRSVIFHLGRGPAGYSGADGAGGFQAIRGLMLPIFHGLQDGGLIHHTPSTAGASGIHTGFRRISVKR